MEHRSEISHCYNFDQTVNAAIKTCHPTQRRKSFARLSARSAHRALSPFSTTYVQTAAAISALDLSVPRISWASTRHHNTGFSRQVAAPQQFDNSLKPNLLRFGKGMAGYLAMPLPPQRGSA